MGFESPDPDNLSPVPIGYDRADGAPRLGTATPETAIEFESGAGASIPFEEKPESPTIERGDQHTSLHRFTMGWSEAKWRLQQLYRGQVYTDDALVDEYDDEPGYWRVLSARATHGEGETGELEVVSEKLFSDMPFDEFGIEPVDLGLNILKHPRYLYALSAMEEPDPAIRKAKAEANHQVIRRLQDYINNVSSPLRDSLIWQLSESITSPEAYTSSVSKTNATTGLKLYTLTGTNLAKRAAMEIVNKIWMGEESPYLAGYQLTWSKYYSMPQQLHPGGRIEDPITESSPAIPEDFLYDEYGESVFTAMAYVNPQGYSNDGTRGGTTSLSWLRKADSFRFVRTMFVVTRTWIGAPVGFWDTHLFTGGERPTLPDHYYEPNAAAVPTTLPQPELVP
jgi:hypothetical protein